MTVAEAAEEAARRLAAAGVDQPELDAELLLRHVLAYDRGRFLIEARAPLAADAEARFLALVAERAARRPLQHLTGAQAFWRHDFVVGPDVLVPRPETEVLVEACLDELRGRTAPRVADVGTGSGCIAISLALERPDAEVHAVDLSDAALATARVNAARLGASGRVAFHLGNLLDPLAGAGAFDLLASNPPYVDETELSALSPEVREHEPRMALVPAGGDRYALYPALAAGAARVLRPGGVLAAEIGQGMDAEVTRILAAAGLVVERVVPDLQGIPRTVVARRPGYRAATLPE